jgi:hypothetical protein
MTADKKMTALYKSLDFTSKEQYFDYCIESYINGQRSQCRELFKDLPRQYKHELIEHIRINAGNDEVHNFYVGLF